jgi:hypothetical protein
MISRGQVERILEDEVNRRKRAYKDAHTDFHDKAAKISDFPGPDGTERLINAGKTYRSAMDAYDHALREFNNFIVTGVVPERLNRKESAPLSDRDYLPGWGLRHQP